MAPMSTGEKLPPNAFSGEMVQVKIGPLHGAKVFTLHKDILTFYSGYFEKALRHGSTFTEARDGVFWLPDEDIDTWERFAVFLYRGDIDFSGIDASMDTAESLIHMLCRLWVLADRREVPLLMNECIDSIKRKISWNWYRPVEVLPYVYANTAPNAHLRRFILLLVARVGHTANVSPFHESISGHFGEDCLRDLLKLIWDIKGDRAWARQDLDWLRTCPEYHCHGPGEADDC